MRIAIYCSLTRLWPDYDSKGQPFFGLNLSAAVDPEDGADPETLTDLCKPWAWDWEAGGVVIRACHLAPAGDEPPVSIPDPTFVSYPELPDRKPILDLLNKGVDNLKPLRDAAKSNGGKVDDDHVGRMVNFLAYASTLPAPISQASWLSMVFKMPLSIGGGKGEVPEKALLLAVPVIRQGDRVLTPRFEIRPKEEKPGMFTVPFNGSFSYMGRDIEAVVYVSAWTVAAQPPESGGDRGFVDPMRYWVRKNAGSAASDAVWGEDWLTLLPRRASEGLDLAAALLQAYRESPGTDEKCRKTQVHNAVAALRDRADMGLTLGPDGEGLAGRLIRLCKVKSEDVNGLLAALHNYEKTINLETWLSLLARALQNQAKEAVDHLKDWLVPTKKPARPVAPEELDLIHAALRDQETLRQLVWLQWEAALGGKDSFWEDNGRDLRYLHLKGIDCKSMFDRAAVAAFLPGLMPGTREGCEKIRDRFVEAASKYYRSRFNKGITANAPSPRFPAFEGELDADIVRKLIGSAEKFAEEKLVPDLGFDAVIKPTEVPRGVTLQLGRIRGLDQGQDGTADGPEAVERDYAGVGVLMRIKGKDNAWWRCLNIAQMKTRVGGEDIAPQVVVPLRLPYQDGVRQVMITYDNHPLAANSLAGALTEGHSLRERPEANSPDELFCYDQVVAQEGDAYCWGTLPGLKFGQDYQFLPFAIGAQGALPPELRYGHPSRLTKCKDFNDNFKEEDYADYLRSIKYLRTVKVGAPRMALLEKGGRPPRFPSIPEDVTPLSGEKAEFRMSSDDIKALAQAAGAQEGISEKDKKPLVLLAPEEFRNNGGTHPGIFEFRVLPPATDIATWDRWVAADETSDKQIRSNRYDVWTAYHDKYDERSESNKDWNGMIDDPAVDKFYVQAMVLPSSEGENSQEIGALLIPLPAGEGHLPFIQSKGLHCTLKVGEANTMHDRHGDQLTVEIAEGSIMELRIHAAISQEKVKQKFPQGWPNQEEWELKDDHYLAKPLRILLECASAQMPARQQLLNALTPEFNGRSVNVTLNPEEDPDKFKFIKDLVLRRQVWRWTGRPMGEPPTPEEVHAMDRQYLGNVWEVHAFGDRPDDDCLLLSTHMNWPCVDIPIFEEDLSQDRRALYYRFSLQARSRYYGLCPGNPKLTVDLMKHGEMPWRRLLVPCRLPFSTTRIDDPAGHDVEAGKGIYVSEENTRPLLKFIVPLTETSPDQAGPRLLAVFQETFFEIGGLAERLNAEVMEATYEKDESPQEKYLEFGPDPIISKKGRGAIFQKKETTKNKIVVDVEGPIGHTFDTDTDAPAFDASSFLLQLRPADGDKISDFSWHMAKLRFSRKILARLFPSNCRPSNDLASEWTEPQWVQMLPDSSTFRVKGTEKNIHVSSLKLCYDGDLSLAEKGVKSKAKTGTGKKVPTVTLVPVTQDLGHNSFLVWVLVTELIQDMAGKPAESYLGVYRFDGNGFLAPIETRGALLPNKLLRARIMELQQRVEYLYRGQEASRPGMEMIRDDRQNKLDPGNGCILIPGIVPETGQETFAVGLHAQDQNRTLLCSATLSRHDFSPEREVIRVLGQEKDSLFVPKGAPYDLRLTKAGDDRQIRLDGRTDGGKWETLLQKETGVPLGAARLHIELEGGYAGGLRFLAPRFVAKDGDEAEVWEMLFPTESKGAGAEPVDVRARIVRVSEPIDMEAAE